MQRKDAEGDILEAARKIFVQKGYAGARMQAIADEARINKAMLHYYFRSKEALFNRIMEEIVEIMAQHFIPALASEGSVMEKVDLIVEGYTQAIIDNPYIPFFVLNELSQNQVQFQQKIKDKLQSGNVFNKFLAQIQNEQEQGLLKSISPQHFMLTLMSLIVFPFIAKPVFVNMLDIPESMYLELMRERKAIIKDVIRKSFGS